MNSKEWSPDLRQAGAFSVSAIASSRRPATRRWDRLAEIAGRYFGKRTARGSRGRLQSWSWGDGRARRLWKAEIVNERVEMLPGRGKGATFDSADVVDPTIQRFISGPATRRSPLAR